MNPPPKKTNLWLVVGLPVAAGVLIIGVVLFLMIRSSTRGYTEYMRKTKTSEAEINFSAIRNRAERYRVETGSYPVGTAGPQPPLGTCCTDGGKCRPDPALWREEPWTSLDFTLDLPHYFSYEYRGTAQSYTVRAYGDLDCDSTYSTFEITSDTTTVKAIQPND